MLNIFKVSQDKVMHFKAGSLVAAFSAVVWMIGARFGLVTMADTGAVAFLTCLVAGLVKEACDWMENRAAVAAGNIPVHGVESWDAAFTAAPGAFVYAAQQIATHYFPQGVSMANQFS